MEYIQGYLYESATDFGDLGIKVMLSIKRQLTDVDKTSLRHNTENLHDLIMTETLRLDPATIMKRQKEREAILSLFPGHIYVDEIPNGYCSRWCCLYKPWFIVTTTRGRIMIGWRKRVIAIDWNGSDIASVAIDIFPNEDVTKDGRMIHAWGYEKARSYIGTLLVAH